jgi:hypothetical protein
MPSLAAASDDLVFVGEINRSISYPAPPSQGPDERGRITVSLSCGSEVATYEVTEVLRGPPNLQSVDVVAGIGEFCERRFNIFRQPTLLSARRLNGQWVLNWYRTVWGGETDAPFHVIGYHTWRTTLDGFSELQMACPTATNSIITADEAEWLKDFYIDNHLAVRDQEWDDGTLSIIAGIRVETIRSVLRGEFDPSMYVCPE